MANSNAGTPANGTLEIHATVHGHVGRVPVVTLQVAGQEISTWTKVDITRTIEAVSGSFELGLKLDWADPFSNQAQTPQLRDQVKKGDPCVVSIADGKGGGEAVITGYIDDANPEYDEKSHTLVIKGRDRTADLADCSAYPFTEVASAEGTGPFAPVLARLVAPYHVAIEAQVPLTGFVTTKVNPGETILEFIERHGRQLGVMPISDGKGKLLLTRAGLGGSHAALLLGGNIKSGKATDSLRERYSDYYVIGQAQGDDDNAPAGSASIVAHATDPGVRRHRLLVVQAEHSEIGGLGRQRAAWEANVRRGKSFKVTYPVRDWWDNNGKLWDINRTLLVFDPWVGLDEPTKLLIAGVKLTQTRESGTIAVLTLTYPDAYSVEPAPRGHGGDSLY